MATFAELLSQYRPHVVQVVQQLARSHHLAPHEISEFASRVDHVLERNDYEALRSFEGRSTWETYLSIVVTREFFSFQAQLWGEWRPSALALRLGPTAILLEELVARDRMSFDDAVRVMRSTHRVDLPVYRLEALYRDLRLADSGEHAPTVSAPESGQLASDVEARKRVIEHAMRDAFALLSPDERLMLRLRYSDREPLTRIAKLLKDDPRPLQRRIEQAREVFCSSLRTQGIRPEEIDAIFDNADPELRSPYRKWWQSVFSRPSND